jgi:hypothetical protein
MRRRLSARPPNSAQRRELRKIQTLSPQEFGKEFGWLPNEVLT